MKYLANIFAKFSPSENNHVYSNLIKNGNGVKNFKMFLNKHCIYDSLFFPISNQVEGSNASHLKSLNQCSYLLKAKAMQKNFLVLR